MGRYLRQAQGHADMIKHYYDCAGAFGYGQAEYDFNKLDGLLARAGTSKSDKLDVQLIQALRKAAREQMDEMARRRDELPSRRRGQTLP